MTNDTNGRILYPDIRFSHQSDVQIRFADYDTFGHVNNNAYMAYFDLGKTEFLSGVMERRCAPSDLAAAIVNINVDFLSPAVIGEPLAVLTAVVRVGGRSFTLYQRVVNPVTGAVKAQATSVLAGFDIATQGPGPVNAELAGKLRLLVAV